MRGIASIALIVALQTQGAFACSIDELRKLAAEPLDRLPSSIMHEPDGLPESGTGDGAMWQTFAGENGHTQTILLTYLGHTGQSKVRMSFLNRKDFVVVDTNIEYDKPLFTPDGGRTFKIKPPQYYYFCGGEFQLPADAPNAAQVVKEANVWKNKMSESIGLLKQEFDLIPE